MGQAGQHQEQCQLAEAAPSRRSRDAELLGLSPKYIKQPENGTDGGIGGGKMIEITTQGSTERPDARGVPRRDRSSKDKEDICALCAFPLRTLRSAFVLLIPCLTGSDLHEPHDKGPQRDRGLFRGG
jgi:hypothetical protein